MLFWGLHFFAFALYSYTKDRDGIYFAFCCFDFSFCIQIRRNARCTLDRLEINDYKINTCSSLHEKIFQKFKSDYLIIDNFHIASVLRQLEKELHAQRNFRKAILWNPR